MTDPIADMFVRIKNAERARRAVVLIPYSRMKHEIAKVLEAKGRVTGVAKRGKKNKKTLELKLTNEPSGEGRLVELRRISKPSRRVYIGYKDLHSSPFGGGFYIISTPAGVVDDAKARKLKTGGEVLGEVY